jgi:ABC-type branched-subunit amino acid transport system ATPase component
LISDSAGKELVLKVENLTKNFGGVTAVDNCSLKVDEKSITGLIGPNGAGKTTLFDVISGFYRPEGGKVFYRGEDITRLEPHEIARRGLVRTFQTTRVLGKMTVLENLMLAPKFQIGESIRNIFLRSSKISDQESQIHSKAQEVLKLLDLERLQDEYSGNLSGGQRKLLELARALMMDPDIILLDEPMAGVNPILKTKITKHINEVREVYGKTFFIIEHDMKMIMSISDHMIVMNQGKVLAEGKPEMLRKDERVIDAYLGERRDVA